MARWIRWKNSDAIHSTTGVDDQDAAGALGTLSMAGILCLVLVGVALALSQTTGVRAAFGVGTLIVIAGICSGGFVGFLFSLPRAVGTEGNGPASGQGKPVDGATARQRSRLLASNTNLEQISDRLTTMLVGVALSQLALIPAYVRTMILFVDKYARVFVVPGGAPSAGALPVVSPFLLVFGLFSGFIFFYLHTRISLTPIFLQVERILNPADEPVGPGSGKVSEAAERLAVRTQDPTMAQMAGSRSVSVAQGLNVITGLLYEKDGYQEAIDIGNTLASTAATQLPRYWLLMAAAFGQKYAALTSEAEPDSKAAADARNAAVNAAREAIRRDAGTKEELKRLADPRNFDNDLAALAGDAELHELLM